MVYRSVNEHNLYSKLWAREFGGGPGKRIRKKRSTGNERPRKKKKREKLIFIISPGPCRFSPSLFFWVARERAKVNIVLCFVLHQLKKNSKNKNVSWLVILTCTFSKLRHIGTCDLYSLTALCRCHSGFLVLVMCL